MPILPTIRRTVTMERILNALLQMVLSLMYSQIITPSAMIVTMLITRKINEISPAISFPIMETEDIIEKQRAIKDQEEIKYITKACNITDDCFEYLLTNSISFSTKSVL